MEDKIEVNDYVRTDKGEITKVTFIAKETLGETLGANEYRSIGFCNTETYVYGNIVKHSKQLIDLIECGDYVNGRKVKHIGMFEGFPDYPKLIFVDETHLIPNDTCENEDIKTILTKESYMANCYKVGGEDEKI